MIKEIMDGLEIGAFTLSLTQIGCFKRREGNILWLGVEENNILLNLNNILHQSLIEKGFELEDREYKPHITLGRKVILKDSFRANEVDELVRKIEINIDKVDLMKSEFVNGKLIYSVVYSRQLA